MRVGTDGRTLLETTVLGRKPTRQKMLREFVFFAQKQCKMEIWYSAFKKVKNLKVPAQPPTTISAERKG
jgi:hypothetical protein